MRQARLVSFRVALLTSMGLVHACGSRAVVEDQESTNGDDDRVGLRPAANDGDSGTPTRPNVAEPGSGVEPTPEGGSPLTPPGAPLSTGGDTATPAMSGAGPVPAATATAAPTVSPPVTTAQPVATSPVSTTPPVPTTPTIEAPPPLCSGAELVVNDGLLQCSTGLVHRVSGPSCPSELPRPDRIAVPVPDAGVQAGSDAGVDASSSYECLQDADCTEREHGACVAYTDWGTGEGPGLEGSRCTYGCVNDESCGPERVCVCSSPVGFCVPATCTTDQDCAAGQLCAEYTFDNGCGVERGFACTTAEDECHTNEDCLDPGAGGGSGTGSGCSFAPPGLRQCKSPDCVIGRPFLVHKCERLATTVVRNDWLGTGPVGQAPVLPSTLRSRIAAEWLRVGRMEHASIAAFARFVLELLAVAAPPELVRGTQRAMADETLHTELAFALARRYGETPLGPGPLDVSGALTELSLERIVENTVLEGCIGETVAALEAAALLDHATDPEVRRALTRIAEDEARHARLAWDFVRWATRTRPDLAERVLAVVTVELRSSEDAQRDVAPRTEDSSTRANRAFLLAHGVFGEEARATLRAEVLRTVVLPCALALRDAGQPPMAA